MNGSTIIVEETGKWRQFIATIIVNLSALGYGTAIGFCSPSMTLLQSDDTPVGNTPLTDEEISWLNSAMAIGGLAVLPFCSFISEKLGRKITGCLIAIPFVICWLLTIFASNYTCLLFARLCVGVAGAMCLFLVPIYVAEISNISIRGQLGSLVVFAVNIGILLGYIVGASLSYQLSAICALVIPVIFFGLFILMPDTPIYLVRNKRITEATRSLMWLKGNNKLAVDRELLRLQDFVKENSNSDGNVGLRDLFRDRGTAKGFMIAVALMAGQQLCGISAVISYTSMIFKLAGSSLTPDAGAIVVGAIQVFGSWLSTIMMERAGRRSLILISCMGMAICHVILGTFLCLQSYSYNVISFSWIPVTALSVYAIVYCLGMGPAPFVVSSEIFSADISGLANSTAQIFMWSFALLTLKFFSTLIGLLGMHGCFFLLASFCIFTFLFTLFIIPETKGRSIESILDELNGFSNEFCQNGLNGYIKASKNDAEKKVRPGLV